jgi:hypothetical protein
MVTSFRQHLRAENKAEQTITVDTYAPLQLAEFLAERGMPTDVAKNHREHAEAFLEDMTPVSPRPARRVASRCWLRSARSCG